MRRCCSYFPAAGVNTVLDAVFEQSLPTTLVFYYVHWESACSASRKSFFDHVLHNANTCTIVQLQNIDRTIGMKHMNWFSATAVRVTNMTLSIIVQTLQPMKPNF